MPEKIENTTTWNFFEKIQLIDTVCNNIVTYIRILNELIDVLFNIIIYNRILN